jgi:hypothetical protein
MCPSLSAGKLRKQLVLFVFAPRSPTNRVKRLPVLGSLHFTPPVQLIGSARLSNYPASSAERTRFGIGHDCRCVGHRTLLYRANVLGVPPARMGFDLSSRFFSISLSLFVGRRERRLVMLVLIEASAKPNVVAIRSKAGPLHLRPNLACKLVSGGARSSQPSCPRSSGAGDQGGRSKSLQRR